MECHCLSYRELPHTTKLFASYLHDFPRVAQWYRRKPEEASIIDAARESRFEPAQRRDVVSVLREQNERFGADPSVARNLDRLADGAVAIVTGQQVGIFTGPAYSFYKALTAIFWADHISSRGIDAVPVFWLATEDHDLAEVSRTFWNTRSGIAEFELADQPEYAGRSVGDVPLPSEIANLVVKADGCLEGSYSGDVSETLKACYKQGETLGSAFAKLFSKTLAGRGLILLEPRDARLHHLSAGVYRRVAKDADLLQSELLKRSQELTSAGFHSQVRVTSDTPLIFSKVEGGREAVRSRNGKFTLAGKSLSSSELSEAIDQSPEAFSANALLRPIVQDTLLPTVAYIAGPAEVAYYAQSEVLYSTLLGRMPVILPRASFTLVEPPIARILKKYRIEPRDVLRGRQYLRTKLALEAVPRGLANRFGRNERALRKMFEAYRKPIEVLDKTLLGALETAEKKMLYQFTKLRGKVGRAENLRTGVLDRHEGLLINALHPNKTFQERTLGFPPFLAMYGPDLLDELTKHSGPTICDHQICFL